MKVFSGKSSKLWVFIVQQNKTVHLPSFCAKDKNKRESMPKTKSFYHSPQKRLVPFPACLWFHSKSVVFELDPSEGINKQAKQFTMNHKWLGYNQCWNSVYERRTRASFFQHPQKTTNQSLESETFLFLCFNIAVTTFYQRKKKAYQIT